MKLCFITSFIGSKGPNNQLRYLISNLSFRPLVLVIGSRQENRNTIEIEQNAEVVYLSANKKLSIIFKLVEICKLIKDKRIDCIQSFGIRCDIITLFMPKVKRITVVRNMVMVNWSKIPVIGKAIGFLHLTLIKRFDLVVSCSISVEKHLATFGIRSFTITNAIELDSNFKKISPTNKFNTFVTVNTLHPGKNVRFLAEAFSNLPFFSDKHLIIIGESDDKLKSDFASFDNIEFLGYVDNPKEVYEKSDVFISASTHEGMPNAVLEALSVCTPVCLSNIDAHLFIQGCDSSNMICHIFINNDFHSLLSSCQFIKSNMSLLNFEFFDFLLRNHFGVVSMAREYEKLYGTFLK